MMVKARGGGKEIHRARNKQNGYEAERGRANRLSLREHLLEEGEHLRYIQLHVLEVEQVLVVLLLLEKVVNLSGVWSVYA